MFFLQAHNPDKKNTLKASSLEDLPLRSFKKSFYARSYFRSQAPAPVEGRRMAHRPRPTSDHRLSRPVVPVEEIDISSDTTHPTNMSNKHINVIPNTQNLPNMYIKKKNAFRQAVCYLCCTATELKKQEVQEAHITSLVVLQTSLDLGKNETNKQKIQLGKHGENQTKHTKYKAHYKTCI